MKSTLDTISECATVNQRQVKASSSECKVGTNGPQLERTNVFVLVLTGTQTCFFVFVHWQS
eukprot:m.504881 g.504881  ORF g.504881 m.504881 type:complete len:61 (-) comp265864_c0_seq1:54-236(-)